MKAIKRATLPDGSTVQVEDWSSDYPEIRTYGDVVTAYPKSTRTKEGTFAPRLGQVLRIGFHFANSTEANEAFEKLRSGEAVLRDFESKFEGPEIYADCY